MGQKLEVLGLEVFRRWVPTVGKMYSENVLLLVFRFTAGLSCTADVQMKTVERGKKGQNFKKIAEICSELRKLSTPKNTDLTKILALVS